MKKIVKWLGFYVKSNVEVVGEPVPTVDGFMYDLQLKTNEYYGFYIKYWTKTYKKVPFKFLTKDKL